MLRLNENMYVRCSVVARLSILFLGWWGQLSFKGSKLMTGGGRNYQEVQMDLFLYTNSHPVTQWSMAQFYLLHGRYCRNNRHGVLQNVPRISYGHCWINCLFGRAKLLINDMEEGCKESKERRGGGTQLHFYI